MAPKSFYRFQKVPIEIRLRIWNLMMEPRIIRAKWENEHTDLVYKQVYVLAAGPAPKVLHICKESREEAKRKYCLAKSHLPFFESNGKFKCSENSIWVNFDIDTIYFVNFPAMPCFIKYMRRLSNNRISGGVKNIKRIAIHACVLDRLSNLNSVLPSKLLALYQLVAEQPSLETIIIMLDNSKFEDDSKPHAFSLASPALLGDVPTAGGRWGNTRVREKMKQLFHDFFTKPEGVGKEVEMFKKFRENNPDWVVPTFRQLSITKTPKHDYAGDGLPVEQVAKKLVARKSKTTQAGPSSSKSAASKDKASSSG